ncbi:MAG: polysaccharide ABC transporter [Lachnospiraceae bacterium]|nr:polysaccharide ABC transporter [Lachnospiraceae bacterium]
MKKFIANLKRYKSYMIYSAKATLKGEVAGSRLNWLWWILDPFLFMLVYTFMALVVFGKGEPYFPLYVFIGLNMYDFFNRTVRKSVRMVKRNKSMISKVYIPKYVLIINEMIVNAFKMCVAFMLVVVMIPVYRVPLTWHVLEAIPVFLVLLLLTFGCSCIILNLGVFVSDLANVVVVLLKLVFYMSGVFYNIQTRVPEPYNMILLYGNPIAGLLQGARNCILYGTSPYYDMLGIWFVISVVLCIVGVRSIMKYENSYVKVI